MPIIPTTDPYEPFEVRRAVAAGELQVPVTTDLIDSADLREHVDTLADALVQWAGRDDTKAQPQVRACANVAVECIDAALAELHRIRGRLAGQIRRSDDAAAARADALLAECRAARQAAGGAR
jgi:hypothetical protein